MNNAYARLYLYNLSANSHDQAVWAIHFFNSESTLYCHMLGIKNSCKLKLGQVCNSQQESNLTRGWRFTYLLYHMNYSLLVPCCYLDRQEKRFSLLPCAKNTKLYTEGFIGSEKNGNSLNEMKILAGFSRCFFRQMASFFGWTDVGIPFQHSIPKNLSFAIWQPCHCVTETYYYHQPDKHVKYCKKAWCGMYIFNTQFHFSTCM